MSKNSAIKDKIRKSNEWKEFRAKKLEEQKTDPVTGKKIQKGANLHHRCLDVNQYHILEDDRFVLLNRQTHEVLHWIYGDERHKKDWKMILANLKEQCELMDKYNNINNNVELNIAD